MKRLLVLAIVLGIATTANAILSSSLTGDSTPSAGTVHLNIIPSIDQDATYIAITMVGSGTLTSYLGPDAPSDSELLGTMADLGISGTYGNGDVWAMISSTGTYSAGVWLIADYTGADWGDVIAVYETDGGSFFYLDSIAIIPEPATIALLCLGGLMLRRRK